jgi:TonB family protein
MDRNSTRGWILGVAVMALAPVPAFGQFQKPMSGRETTPPPGKRIEAHDGDTIVVRDGGRVRTIRRSEATVRAIYDPIKRWILLLVDYADPAGAPPDGKVDGYYRFESVDGSWPLPERWEGSAVVDDYSMLQGGNSGLGLTTNMGFVQLLNAVGAPWFRDDRAVSVLSHQGGGHGNSPGGRQSFDEAERQNVEQLTRELEARGSRGSVSTSTFALPNGGTATARVGMTIDTTSTGAVVGSVLGGLADTPPPPPPPPQAPVRVGSQIKTPVKVLHVPAVLPAAARQAGISGMVLVEITIGADGVVRDAKVLRSIPQLDAAALAAVRQWRYQPTLLNGVPVAVITTAAVQVQ